MSGVLASLAVAAAVTVTARAGTVGQPTGSGLGQISGYVITDVHFDLSAGEPATIAAVRFSLEPEPPAASHIYASVGAIQYACVLASSRATCRASGVEAPLAGARSLTVTAAP